MFFIVVAQKYDLVLIDGDDPVFVTAQTKRRANAQLWEIPVLDRVSQIDFVSLCADKRFVFGNSHALPRVLEFQNEFSRVFGGALDLAQNEDFEVGRVERRELRDPTSKTGQYFVGNVDPVARARRLVRNE